MRTITIPTVKVKTAEKHTVMPINMLHSAWSLQSKLVMHMPQNVLTSYATRTATLPTVRAKIVVRHTVIPIQMLPNALNQILNQKSNLALNQKLNLALNQKLNQTSNQQLKNTIFLQWNSVLMMHQCVITSCVIFRIIEKKSKTATVIIVIKIRNRFNVLSQML
jgi:hypothetical protein